jgi:hypothetical protein
MAFLDLWFRPWALSDQSGGSYRDIASSQSVVEVFEDCAPIIVTDEHGGPRVDGKMGLCEFLADVDGKRKAWLPPIPLKQAKGLMISGPAGPIQIIMNTLPDAPASETDPDATVAPSDGDILMTRIKRVWTRLRDVEDVIADPSSMWQQLAEIWLSAETDERPKMDEIVKQARSLPNVIERLDKTPRRILRRVHKHKPLSRVQELDRRSMTWLIRQPGDTIAEQAGDRQRIMAVAREENFNTLENRVLLAYARLARRVASDYLPAISSKRTLRSRELLVRAYGKRCRQLAIDLAAKGVVEARSDVTPNFVLLNNPDYAAVWQAWHELLNRKRIVDELWRWQTRSWNEFCALAVIVALQSIDGARVVATSPVVFRPEQVRGCWVESINPLGVIHLVREQLIAEVVYDHKQHGFESWCTPLCIRVGKLGDARGFLRSIIVWPLWSRQTGTLEKQLSEIALLRRGTPLAQQRSVSTIGGMLVISPTDNEPSRLLTARQSAALSLGATGDGLRDGLKHLAAAVLHLLSVGNSD